MHMSPAGAAALEVWELCVDPNVASPAIRSKRVSPHSLLTWRGDSQARYFSLLTLAFSPHCSFQFLLGISPIASCSLNVQLCIDLFP